MSFVPIPNCPSVFVPVTNTVLFPSLRAVCVFPDSACLIFWTFFIFVGMFLFSLSPVPSCPYVFPPQEYTYPSTVVTTFDISPEFIVPIFSLIFNFLNSFILFISFTPIPNCPYKLEPVVYTSPALFNSIKWLFPPDMSIISPIPVTFDGNTLFV